MKEELQRLLDNWDYNQSLTWYKKHVEGKFFLKTMLAKGADDYNTQKLKSELFELLHEIKDEVKEIRQSEKNSIDPKESKTKLVHQAAQSIEEYNLNEEWKPLYKEAGFYFTELHPNNTEEDNYKLVCQIMENMDEVERIWKEKDYVKQYGAKPVFEFQGLESLSPQKLLTRRNTLRSYISKAKKGVLSVEKIPEWEAEMEEIEKLTKP